MRERACAGARMTFEDLLRLQSLSLQNNRPINQKVNDTIYYSNRACLTELEKEEQRNKCRNDKHAMTFTYIKLRTYNIVFPFSYRKGLRER